MLGHFCREELPPPVCWSGLSRKENEPRWLVGANGVRWLGGRCVPRAVLFMLRFYKKYFPAFAPRIIRSTPRSKANNAMNSASISGI